MHDENIHRPRKRYDFRAKGRKRGMPWWLIIVLILIAGIAIWWFFGRDSADAEPFMIEPGRGIVHYTDYQDGIDRAEACGIPLTMGRGESAVPIGYDEARRLESETDRVQVTALVYVGDVFGPRVDDCPARIAR